MIYKWEEKCYSRIFVTSIEVRTATPCGSNDSVSYYVLGKIFVIFFWIFRSSTKIRIPSSCQFRGSDEWLTMSRDLCTTRNPQWQNNPGVLSWPRIRLLTDSDLDIISGGGVFKVVDGAQHVQGHVADMVRMKGGLVWNTCHHHIGITNCLHLDGEEGDDVYTDIQLSFQYKSLK